MLMIFPVCDRVELLPYFLRYYQAMGATQFVCGLYNGKRNRLDKSIAAFESHYHLHIRTSVTCNRDRFSPVNEALGLNAIREEFAGPFGWYGIADLDEFHYFGGRTIPEQIHAAEKGGY